MAVSKIFMALTLAFTAFVVATPVQESTEMQGLKEFHNALLQIASQRSVPTLPIPPGVIECLSGLIANGKCQLGGGTPSGGGEKPCCGPSRRVVMADGAVIRVNVGVIQGTCRICGRTFP